MKDEHIINLLEANKLKDLSDAEFRRVENHAAECAECRREYEAAKVSSLFLRTRAAQTLEPPPFFEARVMNAWRAQQAALKPVADRLRQMWQDAKILVSGLAASVAMLLILTFVVPQTSDTTQLQASPADYYSAESVVFDLPEAPADFTDAQLFQAIYADDDSEK